jgi:hypothetical protein
MLNILRTSKNYVKRLSLKDVDALCVLIEEIVYGCHKEKAFLKVIQIFKTFL